MDKPKGKISFISLGCTKTLVDSERMLGQLAENRYLICEEYSDSEAIIINTCSFIEEARQESLQVIRQALALRQQGLVKKVVVTGCMVREYKDILEREVPDVDGLLSLSERDKIVPLMDTVLSPQAKKRQRIDRIAPVKTPCLDDQNRLRLTPRHYAYLKPSEGCSNPCTFCSIPRIRGGLRSKPLPNILQEAEELARDGVVELNLVAQDTTLYGYDLKDKTITLPTVLNELSQIEGFQWIRLFYAHPAHITPELIQVLKENPKVVKYIDMPIQHINSRILDKMKRSQTHFRTQDLGFAPEAKADGPYLRQLIQTLRREIPGLFIRTTVIVGFPGETEDEFQELFDFIRETRFERLGVFSYSLEHHTPSFSMEGHLPKEIKEERLDRLMRAQREIAFSFNQSWIGKTLQVIVDRPVSDPSLKTQNLYFEGRTYGDAPDADGLTYFTKNPALIPGKIYEAKIVGTREYDWVAEIQ